MVRLAPDFFCFNFCLATKVTKRPSDQITILKTTSERGLRAKPLALQARLSRPPMPLFFVVLLRQFGLRPRV